MLVLIHAAQDEVLAALRPTGQGEAGSTSPSGWTAVRTEDVDALDGPGDAVVIDESEGRVVLEVRTADGTTSWSWCPDWCEDEVEDRDGLERDDIVGDPARRSAVANALAGAFGHPAKRGLIAALLGDLPDGDELIEALDRILDLPEWERGRAARSVVLIHEDATGLRRALRVIACSWRPLQAADLGGSWLAVQGLEFPGRRFAEALAGDLSTGDAPVVHLWRGQGSASGVDLLRRDPRGAADQWTMWRDVELTAVEWSTGWRSVKDDPALHCDALVAEMAVALESASGLDRRPALVRPGAGGDPLRSVVEILGIPAEAIAVLDGADDSPVMQQVKPASILRELWEDTRTTPESRDMAAPHFSFRTVQGFLVIVVGLCGTLSLGMLALKISILVTDGAVVDRPSAGPDDWIFATLFAIATAMNVGIMTLLWWRRHSF